ncbi:MAG TPA: hypothetical protein VJ044_01510 [Candidatus Hodarchaeales archaeon]|nr:hypothetical protein [Candidatus Hodarchaeales archaeon]
MKKIDWDKVWHEYDHWSINTLGTGTRTSWKKKIQSLVEVQLRRKKR